MINNITDRGFTFQNQSKVFSFLFPLSLQKTQILQRQNFLSERERTLNFRVELWFPLSGPQKDPVFTMLFVFSLSELL